MSYCLASMTIAVWIPSILAILCTLYQCFKVQLCRKQLWVAKCTHKSQEGKHSLPVSLKISVDTSSIDGDYLLSMLGLEENFLSMPWPEEITLNRQIYLAHMRDHPAFENLNREKLNYLKRKTREAIYELRDLCCVYLGPAIDFIGMSKSIEGESHTTRNDQDSTQQNLKIEDVVAKIENTYQSLRNLWDDITSCAAPIRNDKFECVAKLEQVEEGWESLTGLERCMISFASIHGFLTYEHVVPNREEISIVVQRLHLTCKENLDSNRSKEDIVQLVLLKSEHCGLSRLESELNNHVSWLWVTIRNYLPRIRAFGHDVVPKLKF